jgi:hypothetical protein
MGDLIIKPEAGGSIKIQNNAGTNALVSDNSGNITLAGNTTLSGTANNIGTVTAGTLGTGIVYPAGSVLQMFNVHNITPITVAGSGGTATVVTKTFNRIKGNSHFICSCILACAPVDTAANLDGTDPDLAFVVNGTVHNTFPGLSRDGFYYSTVPMWRTGTSVSYSGTRDTIIRSHSEDLTHISSGSANDSVTIAVQAHCSEYDGFYLHRSQGSTADGSPSSLTIYEIAS